MKGKEKGKGEKKKTCNAGLDVREKSLWSGLK